MKAAAVALMVMSTSGSAQHGPALQSLPVDDRIRLMVTMNQCWATKKSEGLDTSASGSAGAQVDGVFKKLINGRASLAGGAGFKEQLKTEFAPFASDDIGATIEACYRIASGGDSLNLKPAPVSAPTSPPKSTGTPRKAVNNPPNLARPPDWTCREPAVFLSARCDKGGLGRKDVAGKVLEEEGIIHGWHREERSFSTLCEHTTPSEGSVRGRQALPPG